MTLPCHNVVNITGSVAKYFNWPSQRYASVRREFEPIEPIKTAPELSRYAYQMHNCSSTYAHTIATGRCFLYVVLQENIPKAMVELERSHGRAVLSQLQGPCNEVVSEELGAAVDTWLEAA